MKAFKKALLLSSLLSSSAIYADSSFYVEGSIGSASHDNTIIDETATSFGLTAGVQLNPYFAPELAFANLGTYSVGDGVDLGVFTLNLGLVGSIPVSSNFSLLGKVGLSFWDIDAQGYGESITVTDGTDIYYGLGAKFQINEQVSIGGNYDIYRLDIDGGPEYEIDNLALTVGFTF